MDARTPRGRPPLPPAMRRDCRISVMLTPDVANALDYAAMERNISTSALIRDLVLAALPLLRDNQ